MRRLDGVFALLTCVFFSRTEEREERWKDDWSGGKSATPSMRNRNFWLSLTLHCIA